jgi:hypothetical protein
MTETELKLADAATQFQLAMKDLEDEAVLRSCVNAFIGLGRSVTMVMEKESAAYPELLEWYKSKTAIYSKIPMMRFFNDQRVHTIHRGVIKPIKRTGRITGMQWGGKKILISDKASFVVWEFDGVKKYMENESGNVPRLCESYLLTLKLLVHEWMTMRQKLRIKD